MQIKRGLSVRIARRFPIDLGSVGAEKSFIKWIKLMMGHCGLSVQKNGQRPIA